MNPNTRYDWIDFLKALAMIAVVLNHTYNIIFTDRVLLLHTIFSVTMFVFVAGITAAISIDRQKEVKPKFIMRRISGILIPYTLAALMYNLYVYKGVFSLSGFFVELITFSYPAMYYIAFFIQLVLISTLLFKIIKAQHKSPLIILVIGLIYFLSVYLTENTIVSNIALAGGNILGGTYLFVYALGILFYMWMPKPSNMKTNLIFLVLCMAGLIFFENRGYIFNSWSNPPTELTMLYTLLIFGIVFSVFNVSYSRIRYIKKGLTLFNYIGKHSLYIYLYHFLFIRIATEHN
ncbi:acyltransferase [Paenibacillus algorifonticola]|uniref:acyltransferase family protein n=1 Tax=Paenibacillus algorifonticola TaxID=684063 RepID=UPI003D2902BD